MANNSNQILYFPDGYTLPDPSNSFTSQWGDKRSAPSCSISLVFSGAGTPDGYAHIETSNSPEGTLKSSSLFGFGQNGANPPDASTLPGSTVQITATGVTKWDLTTPARWVRVVYVSSVDSANLNINVWYNSPFSSP